MTGVRPRDGRGRSGYVQGHLSMFQMSWSSFHWPSSLCQTTALFERHVLRISALGRESSGADLSRRIGAERLHVEGRQLDVAGVVLHLAGPEFLDVGPA